MDIPAAALLQEYYHQKKCIPAFNVYNLESISAGIKASSLAKLPVILAFGESYLNHMPFQTVRAIVDSLLSQDSCVILHLDHCKNLSNLFSAVNCGFDSVMFDGSSLSLEENIRLSRTASDYAHSHGVMIECELGGLNNEDGSGTVTSFTDPDAAKRFVQETDIDSLAVSVGNVHGLYRGEPSLRFDLLAELSSAVPIPLVLHGCSGIPNQALCRAVSLGVSKININTELALGSGGIVKNLLSGDAVVKYDILALSAEEYMIQKMFDYLNLAAIGFKEE